MGALISINENIRLLVLETRLINSPAFVTDDFQ